MKCKRGEISGVYRLFVSLGIYGICAGNCMSERYVLGNRIIAIKYVKTYGDSPRVSKQGTVFMMT